MIWSKMRVFHVYSSELASTAVHIFYGNVMIWSKMRVFHVYSSELASTAVHIFDENWWCGTHLYYICEEIGGLARIYTTFVKELMVWHAFILHL